MRTSQFSLVTLKETPSEAEIISQKLMLKAGFIRRIAAGIYSWLPWGLRSLRKIENIVREEMNRIGAAEILMPSVQPAELWKESGRWEKYGPELLRFKDRHQRDFCLGPTHEEVITDIARRDIQSFRQLPRHYYQIQWKFRDEVRPRFGIMRGREFLMKDSYSFHTNVEDLKREYEKMYHAYCKIFTRLGLEFRAVAADAGSIGGNFTHEFHVLADSGEDIIAYSSESDYAANIQMAEAVPPPTTPAEAAVEKKLVATPNVATCEAVAYFLHLPLGKILKTLAVMANDTLWLFLLRGDHSLNDIKVRKLPGLADFRLATDIEIIERLGCPPGFLGPVDIKNFEKIKVLADHSALAMRNFSCGANQKDCHLIDVNWQRDVPLPAAADLRYVLAGDPSPDGRGILKLRRGIEVGQVFQLGDKYSAPMNCRYLDQAGKSQVMQMGCYGIGVSRILGAAIEQGNDDNGMILPYSIAPFSVAIAPMGFHKSEQVRKTAEELYASLLALNIDVVLDDRDERPGVMLADLELVGIPHRLTVGEKSLKDGMVEYQLRSSKESVERWPLSQAIEQLQARLANHNSNQPQA